MRTHPARMAGDHTISEDGETDTLINGTVTVEKGVKVTLKRMISGNLVVGACAVVRLGAIVLGQMIHRGGTITQ